MIWVMIMEKIKRNTIGVLILLVGLYVALIVYFCYAVLFYGNRWFSDSYNTRVKMDARQPQIIPGDILDRNGEKLAWTEKKTVRNPDTGKKEDYYTRVYYSKASSVAHVVGFHNSEYGRMGVEAFHIYYLMGYNNSLIERIYQKAFLPQERGNDVVLTVDRRLQEYVSGLIREKKKKGSVVLLNPKTGEILAMVSYPTFDPNNISKVEGDSLVNRTTQGLFPPGSIFKIITTAAAFDNIEDVQQIKFNCQGDVTIGGQTVRCYRGNAHGEVDIRQAFNVSCNTFFARLGVEIGWKKLLATGKRFGFNDDFLFDDIKVTPSSLPLNYRVDDLELAWSAIGQGKVLVTPLHMAMLAASIGNDGIMMEPKLVYQVIGRNKNVQKQLQPEVYKKAISHENASILKKMMETVVLEGTGRNAQSKKVRIAGKTGTAERGSVNSDNSNLAWFIGFAPAADPTLAIAVLIEDVGQGKTGGSEAAPLARKVIEKAVELGY
jgi:peptidoglycan glycosyltransferase